MQDRMIEILRIVLNPSDTFDFLVSCERTFGEDILLAHEIFFWDLGLIVDPVKESCDIESSK